MGFTPGLRLPANVFDEKITELRTQQRDVVAGLGDVAGDIEQEDAEGEEHHNAYLHLLSRGAEENGQQQHGGEYARQYDVHYVKGMSPAHVSAKKEKGNTAIIYLI